MGHWGWGMGPDLAWGTLAHRTLWEFFLFPTKWGQLVLGHILVHTELPAWGTYFFICPYGPAKLWNVKKYVFQARNSLARPRGGLCPVGGCSGREMDVQGHRGRLSVRGLAVSPSSASHCSATLPVSAGGSARQTLNIQCADCGRGRRPSGRPGVPSGASGAGGGVWELGLGMGLAVTLVALRSGGLTSRKGVGSGAGTAQNTGRGSKF